jgi:hypothetical protein
MRHAISGAVCQVHRSAGSIEMAELLHVCVDRIMPIDQQVEAADRAIAENPANVPVPPTHPAPGSLALHPVSMALITGAMWPKAGRRLRVSFLDGDPAVQARIPKYAEVEPIREHHLRLRLGSRCRDPDLV